jgi:conjugative transfer region protein TrbK
MRSRLLTIPAIGRAVACVLVAAAIIAAAVQFHRQGPAQRLPASPMTSRSDPLASALARCQTLGMAAENDAACQAAWAENRRRFFDDLPATETR